MYVFCSYLLLAISALPLHGFHQLHQSVYERLLGSQQRAHHPHALIPLEGKKNISSMCSSSVWSRTQTGGAVVTFPNHCPVGGF